MICPLHAGGLSPETFGYTPVCVCDSNKHDMITLHADVSNRREADFYSEIKQV
jgi:hypothetical protein